MAKTTKTNEKNKIDLTELKDELKDYIDIKLKNSMKEELEKTNKRLIREKNKKIFFRNIVILVLLAIILLLLFFMYNNRFFDEYLGCSTNISSENSESIINTNEKEKTLDELVKEYSYLLDNVNISEDSKYINDYYDGNLSNELKNYLAFNNIDTASLITENDYNLFDSSLLKGEYNILFDDNFEATSFDYVDNKIRYISKMDYYITEKKVDIVKSNINREIINIEVDDDKVIFTCIEGVIKDGHLFNIQNGNEIKYKDGKLSDYAKELTKVTYTFKNDKLDSIK